MPPANVTPISKPRTVADDYATSPYVDHAAAHRQPLVPLTGNLAERVASLNTNNVPTLFRPSPYSRFDNKLG